jgi:hypothetical protein
MNLMRSQLRASPRVAHCMLQSAREFCRWLSMLITFGMKGSSYLCSQITGGVKNAVPLHIDIPLTGRRGFYLPSEDSLQEYLKFPYECFLSVLQWFKSQRQCKHVWNRHMYETRTFLGKSNTHHESYLENTSEMYIKLMVRFNTFYETTKICIKDRTSDNGNSL